MTRERVVAGAASLADRDGLDALSLAQVAEELGVRAPSLYNHVDGMDGLLAGIRELGLTMLRDRLRVAAVGRAGPDAVAALARAVRLFGREHPGLYAATVAAGSGDSAAVAEVRDELLRVVLDALRGFSLTDEEVIHAARFVRSTVHGFVSLEAAGGFGLPVDLDASFERMVESVGAVLTTWGGP